MDRTKSALKNSMKVANLWQHFGLVIIPNSFSTAIWKMRNKKNKLILTTFLIVCMCAYSFQLCRPNSACEPCVITNRDNLEQPKLATNPLFREVNMQIFAVNCNIIYYNAHFEQIFKCHLYNKTNCKNIVSGPLSNTTNPADLSFC